MTGRFEGGEPVPRGPDDTRADRAERHALVLAAGRGSRLDRDAPKPAYELLGVPLLGRVLFTLEEAGVTDAHVVLGHRATEVRRAVERIDRLDLRVHWVRNERWRGRNGLSVLAGAPALEEAGEPFLLAMADHVFEPAVATSLLAGGEGPPPAGDPDASTPALRLAVDTRPDDTVDRDDATKVRTDGGRIVAIGKSLEGFDGLDTGVFLATPELFDALRACDREAGPSLSDGVQRLADRGAARAVDVGGRMWHDVDTGDDVEAAESKLLDSVRSEDDGPVARALNRPISTRVSRWLVTHTSITADQVSVGTLGVGLVSAAFAAVGGYAAHLAAGLLFQLASVLDGTDGEVAKLTFRTSRRGEWVDTLCDNLAYLAFLVGLTVGVHRMGLPDIYVYSGGLAAVAATVSMVSINLHLLARDESGSARAVDYGYQESDDAKSRAMQLLHYLGKRDMLAMVVLALAAVGRLHWGLPLFAVAATVLMVPATGGALLSALRDTADGPDEPGELTEEVPAAEGAAAAAAGGPGGAGAGPAPSGTAEE